MQEVGRMIQCIPKGPLSSRTTEAFFLVFVNVLPSFFFAFLLGNYPHKLLIQSDKVEWPHGLRGPAGQLRRK